MTIKSLFPIPFGKKSLCLLLYCIGCDICRSFRTDVNPLHFRVKSLFVKLQRRIQIAILFSIISRNMSKIY